jgi:DNA-3-methyladenine glycosylase III (EC 3.2.2.-)
MGNVYLTVFQRLFHHYGPQHWWPADSDFEMMIGAILVQNTNWKNAEAAIRLLKPDLTPQRLDRLEIWELAERIRPSGYYNVKARRIRAFLDWFRQYDFDIGPLQTKDMNTLRSELLSIKGIGRETADSILVYVFQHPVFIVDAYARRIFFRIGLDLPDDYDDFRAEVESRLPGDTTLLNEYHALLVEHGKQMCRAKPLCGGCPLESLCLKRISEDG